MAGSPDILQTIEFDHRQALLWGPGTTDPADGLPPSRAADGLLTGLLQLAAVTGARPGSSDLYDRMEIAAPKLDGAAD